MCACVRQAGLDTMVITPSLVPASSPVKLNTSEFYDIVPGFQTDYPNLA